MTRTLFLPGILAVSLLTGCATQQAAVYRGADFSRILTSGTRSAVCLPLLAVNTEYFDNTTGAADVRFSDSFLVSSADMLLLYETSRRYKLVDDTGWAEVVEARQRPAFSILAGDTGNRAETAAFIAERAQRDGAEFVLVPYRCTVSYRVFQPQGWRQDVHQGGSYSRPTTYKASTLFHLQVWHKNGTLLYERVGKSDTGKPLLYSWFKKESPKEDIQAYARRFYAPPLIKSLQNAIAAASLIQ